MQSSADPLFVLNLSSSLNDVSGRGNKLRRRCLKNRSGSADTLPSAAWMDNAFSFSATMSHENKLAVLQCCLKDSPRYRKCTSTAASRCSISSARSSSLNNRKIVPPKKISNQRYSAPLHQFTNGVRVNKKKQKKKKKKFPICPWIIGRSYANWYEQTPLELLINCRLSKPISPN